MRSTCHTVIARTGPRTFFHVNTSLLFSNIFHNGNGINYQKNTEIPPTSKFDDSILQHYKPHNAYPTTPENEISSITNETSSEENNDDGIFIEDTILPLPSRKTFHYSEAAKVREVLAHIRSMTYLVENEEALQTLHTSLVEARCAFENSQLKEDGLALETPVLTNKEKSQPRENMLMKEQTHCHYQKSQKDISSVEELEKWQEQ